MTRKPKSRDRSPPKAGGVRSTRRSRNPGGPGRAEGRWQRRWRIARAAALVGVWSVLALVGLIGWYAWDLPDPGRLESPTRHSSVTLLAADGSVLATFGDLYAEPVAMAELPPYLVQAVVATEDRRFFEHGGFDPLAVLRAAYVNLREGSVRQGGSTLTQQLAKNLFLAPERTVRRKVQELLLALWLEARFTKPQLFTLYINRVYLGAGTYGVEAAAQRYFGKSARRVSLHEAAVLAGLLKAPSRYAPTSNPEGARERAAVVLGAMADAGFITPVRAASLARRDIAVANSVTTPGRRYLADWVLERLGGYVGRRGRDLVVETTLDPRLQARAERALAAALDRDGAKLEVSQGAAVVLGHDGAVRAMVGGRDYAKSQFNRAAQALRQPGSAFKIAVYLAGLEAGLTPETRMTDRPLDIGGWRPTNYDDAYHGEMSLTDAFARSINTIAVQVSERAGRANVVSAARRLGITADLAHHPSLALGASEVTLLELTSAYAVIANGGYVAWPYGIRAVRDAAGRVLFRRGGIRAGAVIDERDRRALDAMMRAVVTRGTGKAARLPWRSAGKTGTSQGFRDAWFIGYTDDIVAGVWVGNDDGTPTARVSGGSLPARIWRDIADDPAAPARPPRRPGLQAERGK